MGLCLLETFSVNFLSLKLLLGILWELFKNNQWWFPSYHTDNLKRGFISLFRVILSDQSTIALLDYRVQTVRRRSDEEILPACLKKQSNFLPRSRLGANIGSWTSRLHMTEPNKICRSAKKTPATVTRMLGSGFLAATSFSAGWRPMPYWKDLNEMVEGQQHEGI